MVTNGFYHNLFLPLFGLVSVFAFSLIIELIFLIRHYNEAVRVSNLVSLYSNTLDMSISICLLDSSLASLFFIKSSSSKTKIQGLIKNAGHRLENKVLQSFEIMRDRDLDNFT